MHKQTKALKRLFWAQGDIQAARELCDHILAGSIEPGWKWRAVESGIVVSYARPFGENKGLGRLSSRFECFHDPKLATVHKMLLHTRDVVVAHNNLLERKSVLADNVSEDEAARVTIMIESNGQNWWTLPVPHLQAGNIRRIAELCRFQEERIRRESDAILIELARTHPHEPGTYQLGADFP